MTSYRDAVLRGTSAAATALDALALREQLEPAGLCVDVFKVIDDLGLPLMFRPLDALLGACVRASAGRVGIIITTQRDLHMQRFTAAHELGHFLLEHEGSLDREVGYPGAGRNRDPLEVEADAFASEFLMPGWLLRALAERRRWNGRLREPEVVYQLSLRLAVSYEATCWGLAAQNLITYDDASSLVSVAPKRIKSAALRGVQLEDPWADVWLLEAADDGAFVSAGPTDVLILTLEEDAAAGYLWDARPAEASGFRLLGDERSPKGEAIGGPVSRQLVLSTPGPGLHHLSLAETRPWQRGSAPIKTFAAVVSSSGREPEGRFHRTPDSAGVHAQ